MMTDTGQQEHDRKTAEPGLTRKIAITTSSIIREFFNGIGQKAN